MDRLEFISNWRKSPTAARPSVLIGKTRLTHYSEELQVEWRTTNHHGGLRAGGASLGPHFQLKRPTLQSLGG